MGSFLKSVSTNSGFLQDCPVEFVEGLNCVIGARGTCKSTLVESIRFAFNHDPVRVSELLRIRAPEPTDRSDAHLGLVRATLGAGSISCQVHGSESLLVVEREVDGEPRVFVEGVREHANVGLLDQIEIFSQGDLQRIAESDELRIHLIDRPNAARVAYLLEDRRKTARELSEVGPELRALRAQISAAKQEVQPAAQLLEQLKQVQSESPVVSPELESQREAFESRERLLEFVRTASAIRDELLQVVRGVSPLAERFRALLDDIAKEARAEEASESEQLIIQLYKISSSIRDSADAARAIDLAQSTANLRKQFDEANTRFYELRQEEQSVNESLKKEHALRRQIEHLERRSRELRALQSQETELVKQREGLRAAIAAIDNEIFTLRVAQVEAVNREHGETVHLTLHQGTSAPNYTTVLSNLLAGSRIRAQEEVAAAIAGTFPPAALIDVVESGSGQRFADVLGRDPGQMNRVVAHLSENEEIYRLETEPPSARLEITMFDEGEPKAVDTLSKGQKATALLPLILRPLPYPLIIDQPEDDLDNKFIAKLVHTLRVLKQKRQLIFVTHNANIPVLGDADRVIVMSMTTPTRAATAEIGTVDQRKQAILDLLEGGAQAFRDREAKYGELLKS